MNILRGEWQDGIYQAGSENYICGYCNTSTGPLRKYICEPKSTSPTSAEIFICPTCNKPTFLTHSKQVQVPGPLMGSSLEFLPTEIESLYNEARNCISVNSFTASVLSCRKLLMSVSVSKGAEPGKSFGYYVGYLNENHFIPPDSTDWVDLIRKKGNEATHEIPSIQKEDAEELIEFTEMLLRFVYELPGKMEKYTKKAESETT